MCLRKCNSVQGWGLGCVHVGRDCVGECVALCPIMWASFNTRDRLVNYDLFYTLGSSGFELVLAKQIAMMSSKVNVNKGISISVIFPHCRIGYEVSVGIL